MITLNNEASWRPSFSFLGNIEAALSRNGFLFCFINASKIKNIAIYGVSMYPMQNYLFHDRIAKAVYNTKFKLKKFKLIQSTSINSSIYIYNSTTMDNLSLK